MHECWHLFKSFLGFFGFEGNKIVKDNSFPVTLLEYFQEIEAIVIVNLFLEYSLKDATTVFDSIESYGYIASSRFRLI